ncbi:MAG: TMEM165/GDT1 family protein [Actinomycetota bacterium]|nr:TMEM165/GDT1 family protein [Actinomycetota bacterium]MDA8315951.1 TMEM165/GDT1 family protein [Actinomycetota bacterium]
MSAGVVITVFALVAAAELPDKTMIATVVMGSRNRPVLVWLGAAGAFLIHVALAVAAGRAIELLPHEALEIVVTSLFFVGAVLLLVVPERRAKARGEKEADELDPVTTKPWKVVSAAFGVVLIGELGDLTELLILDLEGRYHEPWAVFVGAYAGLLAASAAGAFGGRALLRVLPLDWIRRAGGLALLGFAAYGIYALAA